MDVHAEPGSFFDRHPLLLGAAGGGGTIVAAVLLVIVVVALAVGGCGFSSGDDGHYPPHPDEIQEVCRGHGGVRSISTDKYGAASVVLCEDGLVGTL